MQLQHKRIEYAQFKHEYPGSRLQNVIWISEADK